MYKTPEQIALERATYVMQLVNLGLTPEQLAAHLGIAKGSVPTTVARARARVKNAGGAS